MENQTLDLFDDDELDRNSLWLQELVQKCSDGNFDIARISTATTTTNTTNTDITNDSNTISSPITNTVNDDRQVESNSSNSWNLRTTNPSLPTQPSNPRNNELAFSFQINRREQEKWDNKLAINNNQKYCCLPQNVINKLTMMGFEEFFSMKKNYVTLVKNNLIKSSDTTFYFYSFKSSSRMNTSLINQELEKFVNIQFMMVEGYKKSLLFISCLLNDDFKFIAGFDDKATTVSVHTMSNLILNHLSDNKLPLYFNLKKPTKSKFVKVFLKLSKTEFTYNVIKSRLKFLIKHRCQTYLFTNSSLSNNMTLQ